MPTADDRHLSSTAKCRDATARGGGRLHPQMAIRDLLHAFAMVTTPGQCLLSPAAYDGHLTEIAVQSRSMVKSS